QLEEILFLRRMKLENEMAQLHLGPLTAQRSLQATVDKGIAFLESLEILKIPRQDGVIVTLRFSRHLHGALKREKSTL
ncbi:MAG: hypothetical protein LWX11_03035, partial [Firmicutes bacterium]|nr:hypothetical protein [Bacillota bacterium]